MDEQAQNDKFETSDARCDTCGEVKKVCCGEFKFSDGAPTEYAEAVCRDCCTVPHARHRALSVGSYERMDCDV